MRRSLLAAAVLVVATAGDAYAQNPPPGVAATPPQQRGGGRGRAIRVMTLTSPAFRDGALLPAKYSQHGAELSPPLAWSGVPDSVRSFLLVVRDLDAVSGRTGVDETLHWLVWNIPGTSGSLPEGVPQGPQLQDGARQISVSGPYFRGPAATANDPAHHLLFELYALDTMLEVPAVGASPAETRAAVLGAMSGRVRGKGVLVALYKR